MSEEITTTIGEEETNIKYLERMIGAIKRELNLQGLTIALATKNGTTLLTSIGIAPHLSIADTDKYSEWG
jgi:hypothetical protein